MVQLKDPPLPKNKNWLAGMAVLILGLFILAVSLMGDVIEKPKKNSDVNKQIVEVEQQLKIKEEALHSAAVNEAVTGNNFDSDVDISKANKEKELSKFIEQEKDLSASTTDEPDYLKERIWGFWYIILPLFIIVGIFLFWVKKKHKEWTR